MTYDLKALAGKLEFNGWNVIIAADKAEAARAVMELCRDKQTIGIGDSHSVKECGIIEQLQAAGKQVVGRAISKEREEKLKAFGAEMFILSANALAFESGEMVNTDSSGNRVAASLYGAPEVCFVVGKNKITDDLASAILRVKNVAAPTNIRAHPTYKTPCAITGKCENCNTPDRICRATVIYHKRPKTHVGWIVLVNEDLGF